MRAVLWGASGAMGKLIIQRLTTEIVGRVSADGENGSVTDYRALMDLDCDMVIDFSHHSSAPDVVTYARAKGIPVVIGTTAHTPAEKQLILDAAKEIPVFYAMNVSLGIAVLCRLAKTAAAAFPDADIEILEIHHNRKVDAPSGTAHALFQAIQSVRPGAVEVCGRSGEGKRQKNEIGVASLRLGNITGIHEVHICTQNQTLVLRHEAQTREMLADGAVEAARFMADKGPGLYNMESVLEGTV